jgi:hypothetical protein
MENLMLSLESLTPQRLLVWLTLADVVLLVAFGAMVLVSGRMRGRSLAAQRAVVERLRAGLAELVGDAEQRAQALESALAAREERLRALLEEIACVEARPAPRAAAARPAKAPVAEEPPPARQTAFDPAEDRLLRELSAAEGAADGRALRLGARGPRR